jgi:hypothetical protein
MGVADIFLQDTPPAVIVERVRQVVAQRDAKAVKG